LACHDIKRLLNNIWELNYPYLLSNLENFQLNNRFAFAALRKSVRIIIDEEN